MPGPAADPHPHRTPKAPGRAGALACVACCALPVLITVGIVGNGRRDGGGLAARARRGPGRARPRDLVARTAPRPLYLRVEDRRRGHLRLQGVGAPLKT